MWVQGQLIPEPTSGYSRSDSTGGRDRNQGRARGQRDLRDDTPDGEGQRSGRRGETRAGTNPTFSSLSSDPFWCMDATKRGRRVVVRGIPGMATYDMVRKLAKNFGILEGEEGCVQMPRWVLMILCLSLLRFHVLLPLLPLLRRRRVGGIGSPDPRVSVSVPDLRQCPRPRPRSTRFAPLAPHARNHEEQATIRARPPQRRPPRGPAASR